MIITDYWGLPLCQAHFIKHYIPFDYFTPILWGGYRVSRYPQEPLAKIRIMIWLPYTYWGIVDKKP